MKIEDLGNEVDALFEEDSVLAQAVVDLQNRRKKISAEKNTTENNISSEEKSVTDESRHADTISSDAESDTSPAVETEAPVFSAEIAPDEDDGSDLSLFETEALAVNPEDVIPYRDENLPIEEDPKPKKNRLFGKKKKTEAEPIKLLEFVVNDKNLSQNKEITTEVPIEENAEKDYVSNEADTAPLISADLSDQVSEDAPIEATPAIIPEPDEETSLPEMAEPLNSDKGNDAPADELVAVAENTESEASSFDEDNSMFLTSFDESTPATEDSGTDTPSEEDNVEPQEINDEVSDSADEETTETEEITEIKDITEDEPNKPAEKSRFIDNVFDFVELFIFSLAAVLLITTFFFRHSVVEGGSMEQTLFDGEHIIISNLFYEPKRGDIIVCEDYTTELRKPIVKRIIAIPGDTVIFKNEGNGYQAKVYVNGEELNEDYVYMDSPDITPSGVWVVGEDEVFVMGDHRNASLDSRAIGTVKIDSIIGKALVRFYPFDKFGKIE